LALNFAIDEPALSLELVIEWPRDDKGWAIALGPPHPFKEFCARTDEGESFGAPLAMRIFSNLPGARVPAKSGAVRPIDALNTLAEFIPGDAYEAATQVVPPPQDDKPPLVLYDREIGCLTVHPRKGGLTVARLHATVPPRGWGITAKIHLAHERSSPTDFALMVCARGNEARELARLHQLEIPAPSFSGWKTLSPLETRSLCVVLSPSSERQLSLHLLTRQAPGASPDFAWARFSQFELNVLPESLAGEDEGKAEPVPAAIAGAGGQLAAEPATN
jgi:hypothetical protein